MKKEANWLLQEKYHGIKNENFAKDLIKLNSGEPLAYVIGWTSFVHAKIWLDSKPLIPRHETEFWVEKTISEINQRLEVQPMVLRILDLCAGSGCVGVAVLKNIQNIKVDFAEIDETHHATIKKNILENGIDFNRTKIFGGNLFENISEKYDFILSNPPYIDPKLSGRIQESVKTHEPDIALFGGTDGMEIIEKIILDAPKYLNPGGILYIEHEPEQTKKIKLLTPNVENFKDQYGVDRFSRINF